MLNTYVTPFQKENDFEITFERIKMNEDPWKTSKKEKDEIVLVKITDVSFFAIFKSIIIFLLVCFIVLPVIIFFITVVLGLSLGNLL
tara:strand:+ start:722 stop:982 length:261 start_codon:yes stop_codon:yes gene_type:complete